MGRPITIPSVVTAIFPPFPVCNNNRLRGFCAFISTLWRVTRFRRMPTHVLVLSAAEQGRKILVRQESDTNVRLEEILLKT